MPGELIAEYYHKIILRKYPDYEQFFSDCVNSFKDQIPLYLNYSLPPFVVREFEKILKGDVPETRSKHETKNIR